MNIQYFNIKDNIYNINKKNTKQNTIINNIILNTLNKIEKKLYDIKKNKMILFTFIIFIPNEWDVKKHFILLYKIFHKDSFMYIYKVKFDCSSSNIIIITNEVTERLYNNNTIKYELAHSSMEIKKFIDSIIIEDNSIFWNNVNKHTKKDICNTNIIRYCEDEIYIFIILFGGLVIDYDNIDEFIKEYINYTIIRIKLKLDTNINIMLYWRLRYKDNSFIYKKFFSGIIDGITKNIYLEGSERDVIIINKKLNVSLVNIEDIFYNIPSITVYNKEMVNIENRNIIINKLKNNWKIHLVLEPITYDSLELILLRIYDEIFNLEDMDRKIAIYLICKFNVRITNEKNIHIPLNSKSNLFIKNSKKIICFWPIINPGHGSIKYIVTNNIIKEYNSIFSDKILKYDMVNLTARETNKEPVSYYKNNDYTDNNINDNEIIKDIQNNNEEAYKIKNDIKLNKLLLKYEKEDKIIQKLNVKQKKLNLECTNNSELFK